MVSKAAFSGVLGPLIAGAIIGANDRSFVALIGD
jgi:hypothetical protein